MPLSTWYPWLKALHVAFMVTWFSGLFYLPRLFIYHAEATDRVGQQRFEVMERRLYALMTVGASVTIVFGLLMLWINPALLLQGWFRIKLLLLGGLLVFHLRCRHWMGRLQRGYRPDDTRWLRFFNEIPVIFLLGIIILAVAKPGWQLAF
ncbi:MAG: CopD family protein [Halioglobus sp.]|nr:CopD family protein [Halioglobus sp.]